MLKKIYTLSIVLCLSSIYFHQEILLTSENGAYLFLDMNLVPNLDFSFSIYFDKLPKGNILLLFPVLLELDVEQSAITLYLFHYLVIHNMIL